VKESIGSYEDKENLPLVILLQTIAIFVEKCLSWFPEIEITRGNK
jgi:hypothetical protein